MTFTYRKSARGALIHVVDERGASLCTHERKQWTCEEFMAFTCGLCGSKLAVARKNEKEALKAYGERA